jgi:hypothetical protein
MGVVSSFARRVRGVSGGGWKGETVRTGVKTGCWEDEEIEEDEEEGFGLGLGFWRRRRDIMVLLVVLAEFVVGGSVSRR